VDSLDPADADLYQGWVRRGTELGGVELSADGRALPFGHTYTPPVAAPEFFPDLMPGDANDCLNSVLASDRGVFYFQHWVGRQTGVTGGITMIVDGSTPITMHTTLEAQWRARREIRIRHVFDGGPGPGSGMFHDHERSGGPALIKYVDDDFDLAHYATNLSNMFVNLHFYSFEGWEIAVGTRDNLRPNHLGSGFNPRVFNQSFEIPNPYNFRNYSVGRLYLIANWRVTPPDGTIWIPPQPPGGGGGGGGGAGSGQQTSPPAGGGVIGGGVGPGPGPWEPPADETVPEETSVPETGGAPLLPVSFPSVTVPASVVPMPVLPSPFTPVPAPEVPVAIELPAIAVPIIGLDSGTWALMNLILAILGAAGAVAVVVHVWLRNRNRAEGIAWESCEESQKRRRQWLMVVGLVSLVSVILFPLTQDMSMRMTLFDVWTLAHLVLLVAQGFAIWQILGRKKEEQQDEAGTAKV